MFCRIMNDLHTCIVVCCYRRRVVSDLSVWVACITVQRLPDAVVKVVLCS
jgi:hypothetical protein